MATRVGEDTKLPELLTRHPEPNLEGSAGTFGAALLEAPALALEQAGKAGLPALQKVARTTIEAIERRIPANTTELDA